MRTFEETVAAGHRVELGRWRKVIEVAMGLSRAGSSGSNPVCGRKAGPGALSDPSLKNCCTTAEWAGEKTPHGVEHLLCHASWDADVVRDDVREYVVEHLHDESAVLVVDETGDMRKGTAPSATKPELARVKIERFLDTGHRPS